MATKRERPHEPQEPQEPPQGAAPEPTREQQLEADLAELRNQTEQANDRLLRLAADFDNYKKRARQEQADTVEYANAALVERLLPVVDDLHRALEHAPQGVDESWLRGLRLTLQKLDEVLAAQGVRPIEAVGSKFDPKLHEAVASEASDEPEDTVIAELRRGYRMNDRVLRPTLVKLARSHSGD